MGSGHSHGRPSTDGPSFDRVVGRRLTIIVVIAGLLTVIGTAMQWPASQSRVNAEFSVERFDGRVVDIQGCPDELRPADDDVSCDIVTVEMAEGPDVGLSFDLPAVYEQRNGFRNGELLSLELVQVADAPFRYVFSDRQRINTLVFLAAAFVIAVVSLGRWRGAMALLGLLFSVMVLGLFTLPALLDGRSPLVIACLSASLITFAALYLAHGVSTTTTAAVLGTLGSLAITVALGVFFIDQARFSGFASEESFVIDAAAGTVDIRGLLLAGLVIGALGALDDMTVTQASVVVELRGADPTMGRRQLFTTAMRVGRDHVASTVNTLFLAYAGASLPLLLLFVVGGLPIRDAANSEVVATEIVRTLVGSIGLVVSVPLTTWLVVAALGPATGTADGDAVEDDAARPSLWSRIKDELAD